MYKNAFLLIILILFCSCKEVKVTQSGGESASEELKYISGRIKILEERVSTLESKQDKIGQSPIHIDDVKNKDIKIVK